MPGHEGGAPVEGGVARGVRVVLGGGVPGHEGGAPVEGGVARAE